MAHPLVEQLGLADLHRSLNALPRRITVRREAVGLNLASLLADPRAVNALHEAFLKKQRQSGSLGFK